MPSQALSNLFGAFAPVPGDPILGLMEAYHADPRSFKVSLGLGVYLNEDGQLPVMSCVRQAEAALLDRIRPRPYLPMEGLHAYCEATGALVLGADCEALLTRRVAIVQTPGASGALRLGAELLRQMFPQAHAWVSNPTWDNHHALLGGAGLQVHEYPYHDTATGTLAFDAMLDTLRQLPRHSIVLLQASCHNPTGIDLSPEQWDALVPVLAEGGLIPFMDMAYQGFGRGLVEDAQPVRRLADAGLQFLVATSFSKNFSLYGERCGALSVVCGDRASAEAVTSQLKALVRASYATPPTHGASVIAQVLNDPALRGLWQQETNAMRRRMRDMRDRLYDRLNDRLQSIGAGERTFDYLLEQRGMFSYTGLSLQQVTRLRQDHGIYLLDSGRLCVAGLTARNVDHVAQSLAAVTEAEQ